MMRRIAPAALAALLVLVACTDVLGPRGDMNSVRLVVQPSFGQVPAAALADNPASRVDNVHVLLRNAGGTVVLDTIIEWPLDQDTLRIEMDVVVQETETFELTIEGRSGDRLLFRAGPMPLELSEDDGGSIVATSPVLEYAGPGADVASVEISDAPGSFLAGSTVPLEATGANSDGSEPDDLIIVWTSLDPDAATVDEDGTVHVGHDASRAVAIEARVAFTTIADTIGGPVLPSDLTVGPEASTLTALGADLELAATLLGEDAGEVTGLTIEWSVVDPSVLELAVDGSEGGQAVATARAPGTTRVIAAAGALADTAEVTVAQMVTRLEVDPAEATLEQVGATARATAAGFDANDNPVADVSTEWVSRDPGVATVAEDGTITGESPGTAWIVATADEAADSLLAEVLNIEPELEIAAPADGAEFEEGDVITFEGSASDVEDGELSGQIEWVSDNARELGTGGSVSAELEPGDHTVTASVTDAHGGTASASVTVTVNPNTPPEVSITSPSASVTVSYGTTVTLEGAAADAQDGDLSSSIEWTSDREDGALGTGASVDVSDLSIGRHTITARVTDSRGLEASATRAVEVVNNAPAVTITAPEDGSAFDHGESITFEASADDVEDGDRSGSIRWVSSINANVGSGGSITTTLSEGTHTITATATDSHDAAGSASIEVTVRPNSRPVVTITTPSEDISVRYGATVDLEATATDNEDGDLSGSIEWTSDLDEELGAGASISTAALSIGKHTIRAGVVDSEDFPGGATRVVEVTNNPPVVEITAPEDGAVFDHGTRITIEGTAQDVEDGDLISETWWSSDNDGPLGRGASVTVELSPGTHEIRLLALDSHKARTSTTIDVTVNETVTGPPMVEITSPADSAAFEEGEQITFEGTAANAAGGDLSGDIVWMANGELSLGTGASVSTSELPLGSHTITATVTDGDGENAAATITIEVVGISVEIGSDPISRDVVVDLPDPVSGEVGADVMFNVDLSGSFGGDLNTFRSQASSIIDALRTSLPDLRVGITSFVDAPCFGFGGSSDYGHRTHLTLTSDFDAFQSTLDALILRGGSDGPESQLESMYQSMTGAGYTVADGTSCDGVADIEPASIGWTEDRLRFLMHSSDAAFHRPDDGGGRYPYPTTDEDVIDTAVETGTKIFFLDSGSGTDQAKHDIAAATGGGVFALNSSSSEIVEKLEEAADVAVTLATVRLVPEGDDAGFVASIEPELHTDINLTTQSTVTFNVTFVSTVTPQVDDQVFHFEFVMRVNGAVIERRPVAVVVPGTGG